ncbi:glycosyltransferase [Nostoc sp. CENA67]|uniref:Glycosyltransferase n=1 Tax=Amazonocrinis nigriterrae CENA67 TaxID=2794033 RepID=A0A8J7HP37_9NOST|nr:glycosyltransferase [Amazonocrinis nigriterrae]MBH8561048.1 glycosyltransferase [Amazonocrinis nigriterrae CENA67]
MTPLVSVIIPCYNAERFLTETIESVFSQTFADYEIILVDDGSTDGTAEVIKSFGYRVRAEFGSNRGASVARNLGTALARGKFIQYLDADDLLRPDALEKRVHALISNDADVAYSDWQRLEENEAGEFLLGNIIARRIEDVHVDPQIALFTDFWSPPAALLYHRRIVEAIGAWNESLPIIQDARFLLDAALMGGKFVYVPGVQADYRVHKANSLSRRHPIKFVLDCFNNACQVEEFWKANGGITPERQVTLEKVYGGVARFFFEYDRSKFYEILARIHNLNPNYLPSGPRILRQLSKWFGYEQAEAIALNYRRMKHFVHSLTKKIPLTST